jgi:hypothetical protein
MLSRISTIAGLSPKASKQALLCLVACGANLHFPFIHVTRVYQIHYCNVNGDANLQDWDLHEGVVIFLDGTYTNCVILLPREGGKLQRSSTTFPPI